MRFAAFVGDALTVGKVRPVVVAQGDGRERDAGGDTRDKGGTETEREGSGREQRGGEKEGGDFHDGRRK